MLTQSDVLKHVNIKERLLRFWIKEYRLKKFVVSKKSGNLYHKDIIFFLKAIKYFRDQDVFSVFAIKKIIAEFKKENFKLSEMDFFNKLSNLTESFVQENYSVEYKSEKKFMEKINVIEKEEIKEIKVIEESTPEVVEEVKTEELSGEDYYFDLLKKAEELIKENRKFDAINALIMVKNNSELYNRVAIEMIDMIRE